MFLWGELYLYDMGKFYVNGSWWRRLRVGDLCLMSMPRWQPLYTSS